MMRLPDLILRYRVPLLVIGALAMGLLLGRVLFRQAGHEAQHQLSHEQVTVWTCSMHPQIRMNEPGKCPICGMDLIPVGSQGSAEMDPTAVHLGEEAMALANVRTMQVGAGSVEGSLRLTGRVQADERRVYAQSAHVAGRVEELLVDFTGERVAIGRPLAVLYAPELVTAEEELLQAHRTRDAQPALYQAARAKLRNWKLSEAQIDALVATGAADGRLTIHADVGGVVLEKRAALGDYLDRGEEIYRIADLSKVWVLFDVYESDLAHVRVGTELVFTVRSLPGRSFTGTVTFVDPIVDPKTRVARARVEVADPKGTMRPGMFATGTVQLERSRGDSGIVVPKSAVLWTGERSVVYVKDPGAEQGSFRLREVTLGPSLGEHQVITSGLRPGEEVVVNGTFTVDAAAQLNGAPSMMSPEGGPAPAGHQHGGSTGSAATGGAVHEAHGAKEISLQVSGNCEMCKARIEEAARSLPGVHAATWDVDRKTLTAHIDPAVTGRTEVSKAISGAGHDTELDQADDTVYDDLPACCLYRGE